MTGGLAEVCPKPDIAATAVHVSDAHVYSDLYWPRQNLSQCKFSGGSSEARSLADCI